MKVPAMKLMKVPALPALCSDITDEMVESENAVICLPPALCSDITDRGSNGYHFHFIKQTRPSKRVKVNISTYQASTTFGWCQ